MADSRDTSQGHKLVTLLAKGNARDGTCRKPRLGWTTCSTEDCTGPGFILKPHSSRSLDESVTEVQGDIIRPNASFILEEIRSRWSLKKLFFYNVGLVWRWDVCLLNYFFDYFKRTIVNRFCFTFIYIN